MIATLLLAAALAIALPPVGKLCIFVYKISTNALQIFGKELICRRLDDESDDDSDYEDQEREPLLGNE